jgi:hypothetical protein
MATVEKPRGEDVKGLTLDEKVRALRGRVNVGLRPIAPLSDLMGISPNKVSSKAPEPIELEPTDMYVDAAYQRDMSRASLRLVMRMVNGWDWRKFKPPVVTKNASDQFVVIDGQHTAIAAATHPDIKRIPAMFVTMPEVEDQANAFVSHNTAQVKVQPLDLFHARHRGGDAKVREIYDIVTKAGVTISRVVQGVGANHEQNETVSIGVLEKLYGKYGAARFRQIMTVVGKCGFTPVRADHMRAVAILLYDRDAGERELSAEYLVDLITALNDADSRMHAAKMASSTKQTKARALAQYWRNQYNKEYGGK